MNVGFIYNNLFSSAIVPKESKLVEIYKNNFKVNGYAITADSYITDILNFLNDRFYINNIFDKKKIYRKNYILWCHRFRI